ncbi:MAG: glycosyl hydrolase family 18 protein, partial [Patescibacteria group bacterium]|nr:glycosyl hydrolase family 18 protein [Patescibacteria group bacterium]
IPYWARSVDITNLPFDSLVYFGVKPDTGGIDKNDPGFLGLKKFTEIKEGKKSYLVLRMLDQKVNEKVLVDKSLNEKIIGETLEIAKNNSFNGVVLDLEVSSMPFTSLTNSINDFVSVFYREAKNKKLKFSIMLYGDTFYKLRPYDVLNLNKNSDGIFIMAYDFHKAGGKPGPNFPLSGKEKYGYDFRTMITDFLNFVPKEKITVVFGMFGYDWQKDDNTGSTAKALSLNEIRSTFDGCLVNCKLTIDNLSTESQILYKDNSLKEHEVWFETMESVSKKKEFLQEKEINKIAFWAYSYF